MKQITFLLFFCAAITVQGQVGQFILSPESDWINTTAPQQLAANYDDDVFHIAIGFLFHTGVASYDSIHISTNGFAWLGDRRIASENIYDPLTTINYWNDQFVISAFGADLHSSNALAADPALEYEVQGTAPDRQLVIVWREANLWANLNDPATENFDIQVVLEEGGDIRIAYHNCVYQTRTMPAYDSVQVGIRDHSDLLALQTPLAVIGNPWSSPDVVDTLTRGGMLLRYEPGTGPVNGEVPDNDQQYRFSRSTSSVDPGKEQVRSIVFPNPVADRLSLQSSSRMVSVQLFDLTGSIVLEEPIGSLRHEVELSALPAGIYLVNVQLEDGNVNTHRVVRSAH